MACIEAVMQLSRIDIIQQEQVRHKRFTGWEDVCLIEQTLGV
jgi:hypothetical protein